MYASWEGSGETADVQAERSLGYSGLRTWLRGALATPGVSTQISCVVPWYLFPENLYGPEHYKGKKC